MLSLFEDNSFKKIQNVASVPQSSGERIRFQTAPCTVHLIFTLHKYLGFKYFKTILCIFILVTPSLQVGLHTFFINSRKYRNGAMLLFSFVFHTDNPSVSALRANCLCCVLVCLKATALTIFSKFLFPYILARLLGSSSGDYTRSLSLSPEQPPMVPGVLVTVLQNNGTLSPSPNM